MKKSSSPLPFFFIGKEVTNRRKAKFIREKYPAINAAFGKEDTRSIWYSREHIAKLLEEIDLSGGDGLRVYFGAYEDDHEFAGQLCLVFNATREKNENGISSHVDVQIEDEPNYSERLTLTRAFDPEKLQATKDYNFGSPCPPRC
jgi:hypothetical protein